MKVIKNVTYGYSLNEKGEEEEQKLDLYLSENDNNHDKGTIIFVHGGGFRIDTTKEQGYIVEFAQEFSKRGYSCISIEYRRRSSEKAKCMEALIDAVEDLDMALEWVRFNGQKYRYDTKKLFLIGGSAGGRTVVTFTISLENDTIFKRRLNKENIKGIANLWGSPEKHFRIENCSKEIVPIISFHGTKDEIINYQNSLDLQKFLEGKNIFNELHTIVDGPHTPVGEKNFDKIVKAIDEFFFRKL